MSIVTGCKQCIVKGCRNTTSEGTFVGDICTSCHYILTTGKPQRTESILSIFSTIEDFKNACVKALQQTDDGV